MKNKRGMLTQDVMAIVLTLIFFAVVEGFIFLQGNGAIVLEQSYAKNIALLIDSAKPITEMKLNMEDAFKLAKRNGIAREDIVKIENNLVTVKLSNTGGYGYSFFNTVDVTTYPDLISENNYVIQINGYK